MNIIMIESISVFAGKKTFDLFEIDIREIP